MIEISLSKMQALVSKRFPLNEFPNEFIIDFIYNSLSFESEDLTQEKVKDVLDGKETDLSDKRILKIKNYHRVFLFVIDLAKKEEELDENTLKDIHEVLMNEENIGGLYRNVDISIEGSNHTPPAHLKVYDRMKKYFNKLEEYNHDPITKAAYSLLQLDKIHPFLDGNGKLARVVANYHLLANNLAPVIFPYTEKQHYFDCIEEFKVNKDMNCFIEYIYELEKKSLDI